jgi:AcrR family transcriptional regulator
MPDTIDWTPKARAVLDSAARLFYERGIQAVGVDAIADEAGVTKKTLYDRFGSKERLVVEYLTARDQRWRTFLESHMAAAGPSPADQVAAVFTAAAAWAGEHGAKGCAMVNAHAEISDPAHPAYAVIVGQKSWMLALFRDLAAAAQVDRPDQVGELVMLLHEGALVMAGMGAIKDPFATAASAAAALLETRRRPGPSA